MKFFIFIKSRFNQKVILVEHTLDINLINIKICDWNVTKSSMLINIVFKFLSHIIFRKQIYSDMIYSLKKCQDI